MLHRMKAALGAGIAALAALVGYGRPEEGGRWHVRSQNLSKEDKESELPLHGRAWLRIGDEEETLFTFSWNLLSRFAHVRAFVDPHDGELGVSVALPPVALWLSFESWPIAKRLKSIAPDERELSLSFHDGAFWWRTWASPNEWREGTPRWREGSFDVLDAVFGKQTQDRQDEPPVPVKVPMPEGVYEGACVMTTIRVGRPRWPSTFARAAEIKLATPIPVPGKGENSYDCDDDAISSRSGPARSPADAVSKLVGSVLRTRERRGGRDWTPPGTTPQAAPVPAAPEAPPDAGARPSPIDRLNRMFQDDPELAPRLVREGKLVPHARLEN